MNIKNHLPIVWLLLAYSATTAADVTDHWLGKYVSSSRPCEPEPIVITSSTLSWGKCVHQIVRVLENTENSFVAILHTNETCGWSAISMRKTNMKGFSGGLDVHLFTNRGMFGKIDIENIKSAEELEKGPRAYCFYGKDNFER